MQSRGKIRIGWVVAGLLVLAAVVMVLPDGGRSARQLGGWFYFGIQRKLYPEQDAARAIYEETAKGPVVLATLVGQFRVAWPSETVAVVHGATCDVATELLHRDDIEVGDLVGGRFVPWVMKPWEAEDAIRAELIAKRDLLTDGTRFVFRRKPAPVPAP